MRKIAAVFLSWALCAIVGAGAEVQAQANWPSHLSLREHSFLKIGQAIANEPGFPIHGTEVQKADYMFSRLPKVVEHYGLTAGTGSKLSDWTVGGLRMFDGLDAEGSASMKSSLGIGNCSEFTFMFQDMLKGTGVAGHVIYADDDPNKGYSSGFTGTDTALYVNEVGPDGVIVRRVFDAFRATHHHQGQNKPWKDMLEEWGNRPMTNADRLGRDPAGLTSWLNHLEKGYVKAQDTEELVPVNEKTSKPKADINNVLKDVLGLWQSPKGAQLLLRGTNGNIEAIYVKRTAQQRVQGMPDNAFYFRSGTLKLGPPVVIESKNGWNYPQTDCKSMAPFTKCDTRVSFTTAFKSAKFTRRAPAYWKKPCQWATGEDWYTEDWQGVKVQQK